MLEAAVSCYFNQPVSPLSRQDRPQERSSWRGKAAEAAISRNDPCRRIGHQQVQDKESLP